MAITLTQAPSIPFDQVYGANPITLSGLSTISPLPNKYVLQIVRGGQVIGDIRQAPNSIGSAIFDIQNILQNFVSSSPNNIELLGTVGKKLMNGGNESVQYQIRYGYETSGVVAGLTTTAVKYLSIGGTKAYYQVPYPNSEFIPIVNNAGPCSSVTMQGKPFSDMVSYRTAEQITDGRPTFLRGEMRVYDHYVTRDDMETISYWNEPTVTGSVPNNTKSIEAFTIWQYNAVGVPATPVTIYNTIPNGGGPNALPSAGSAMVYPYFAITAGVGPKNIAASLLPSTTHYYVVTNAYTYPNGCVSIIQGLGDAPMHYVHRFNIIEEGCNDFPEIQVSWLNSYGFRDYYSFRKRHDRNVSINRNTYLKEAANYNSASYNVNIYDRGTTTYSEDLGQEFVAFTDFLTDAEALFLEKLFISADVKVRFNGSQVGQQFQWQPVTLMNKTYTEKTVRKNQLFQYDITFRMAHNIKSQRG